jgi:TonB-linked SusC/RagA family outer membrane protein
VNYDYQLSERLSLDAGNGFTYSKNNRIEGDQSLNGPLPVAVSMPPVYPVYDSDGSYNNDGPYANPVSIAREEKNLAYTYRNLFNFGINYQLFDQLRLRSQTGFDYYNLGEQTFAPKTTRQGAKYNGLGIEATNNAIFIYNSTFLNYAYSRAEHLFLAMGGFSVDWYRQHGTYLRAQDFPGSSFRFLQDAATPVTASSNELDATSNSVFTSLKYNYGDRYLIQFNLRRDGSSKFGRNNRFGWFPAVSGLWYVSREDFWPRNPVISKLKLRASYGRTGNDQISDYLALDLFAGGTNYDGEAGISPYQLSNPDLKWESTNQLNAGFNLGLYGKLLLTADFYIKNTTDLLFESPVPSSTGFDYYISNVGKLRNSGVEVELAADLAGRSFRWNTSFGVTYNENKVLELYQDQPIRNIGRASSSIEVGRPVSYFYGFKVLGVNPDDGLLIYEDVNEDGKISDLDRTMIGSPYPALYGGFNNSFSFRSFSLDILLYYSYGNEIFNSTRLYTETISLGNQTTEVLERWKNPGDVTSVPKASTYNEWISSRFVEDGSFIRLKNVRLGYTLSNELTRRAGMSSLEFYLAGKNLLILSRYSGMDPEVNYNGSDPIILGTDFFTHPQPGSIILGACVKF